MQIKLLDGSMATVRSWDGVKRRWRFTKIGQHFYRDSQDSYVVTFPVNMSLVSLNDSVYSDASVLKSTTTSLGEIKLPSLMPDDEQLAEVKRLTEQFIANLPADDEGQRVLIEGGGSQTRMTLDTERAVEYNKEQIIIQQDGSMTVDAVLHRPLRAARPWSFRFRGVCPEAYDPTEGKCVSHQLAARSSSTFRSLTWIGSLTRFSMSCTILAWQTIHTSWKPKTARSSAEGGGRLESRLR